MDPVASPVDGYLVFEQLWGQVRHGIAVLGWVILAGLVAAAGCWCCGYVVHSDSWLVRPAFRRRRAPADPATLPDDIAEEAARGIREIERFLSTV